jgi:hypothetical protein
MRAFLCRALNNVAINLSQEDSWRNDPLKSESNPLKNLLLALSAVTSKRSGRSELAKLVTDHVFRHVNFHMLATIVHHESDIHELWHNRASTCPSLDWLVTAGLSLFLHFEKQLWIDERPFLATATHVLSCLPELPGDIYLMLRIVSFNNPMKTRLSLHLP